MHSPYHLVVQFHAGWIDIDAQVNYSEIVKCDSDSTSVMFDKLPLMRTPLNSVEMVKQRSVLMLIWAKTIDQTEMLLIGTSTIKFGQIGETDKIMSPICLNMKAQGVTEMAVRYLSI